MSVVDPDFGISLFSFFLSYDISGKDEYFICKTHAYMYNFVSLTEKN